MLERYYRGVSDAVHIHLREYACLRFSPYPAEVLVDTPGSASIAASAVMLPPIRIIIDGLSSVLDADAADFSLFQPESREGARWLS